MGKIEKDGPGCYAWIRVYDCEDELRLFMCDCCMTLIPQWSLTSLSLKELEQDATQQLKRTARRDPKDNAEAEKD